MGGAGLGCVGVDGDNGDLGFGSASVGADADGGTGDGTDSGADSGADADAGSDAGTDDGATDGGSGGMDGLEVLYEGSTQFASIPDWNPDAPRPLLAVAGNGDGKWFITLFRVAANGELSNNTSQEALVWGFIDEPPVLYEGPYVGGSLPNWSGNAPTPALAMGRGVGTGGDWQMALTGVNPDGSLMGAVDLDEVIVWGWPSGTPGAPVLEFAGKPDGSGRVTPWDDAAPRPLVMLGQLGADTWWTTLASISADGSLADNSSTELLVWGF